MQITMDEGYQFGLGVFETIAVKKGIPLFLDWHLQRMNQSLKALGIKRSVTKEEIRDYLAKNECSEHALKIIISSQNTVMILRDNPYTKERYIKGFSLDFSQVYRNETSFLTRHKTLNYGDSILEKRHAKDLAVDELLLFNSKGQVCEGTVSNVFFVKDSQVITPPVSCGLLPGIVRRYLLENFSVREEIIKREDLEEMDECFVTNSLMGIMPVNHVNNISYKRREITQMCQEHYHETILKIIEGRNILIG
ncbi:branched-chain amino acid aminotransferase [Atopobacter sp. AH10]|uniref:aminotransferase class IV n=1 Tax=Atopobacter sp. AH10 TaxID=2315861 RepID=UPI000EF253DB|nr:aminotransferase class IV [Atopobacter sp. AH10]RLK63343.1 branched-chain amino acid aminotransferase [Atopobacter sp. AH10]